MPIFETRTSVQQRPYVNKFPINYRTPKFSILFKIVHRLTSRVRWINALHIPLRSILILSYLCKVSKNALFPSVFNKEFCRHPCMLCVTLISYSDLITSRYINYAVRHSLCFPILLLCLKCRYSHNHATFKHCEFHIPLFQWDFGCFLT
jgi:hypothetical protein